MANAGLELASNLLVSHRGGPLRNLIETIVCFAKVYFFASVLRTSSSRELNVSPRSPRRRSRVLLLMLSSRARSSASMQAFAAETFDTNHHRCSHEGATSSSEIPRLQALPFSVLRGAKKNVDRISQTLFHPPRERQTFRIGSPLGRGDHTRLCGQCCRSLSALPITKRDLCERAEQSASYRARSCQGKNWLCSGVRGLNDLMEGTPAATRA